MRLLIFGGVGFIGTNVVLEALINKHSVIAFDSLQRKGVIENLNYLKKKKGFQFIKGDIRKKKDFLQIPHSVDCIINFAANPSVPRSIKNPLYDFRVNVIGHLNILEFSRNNGKIPIILASSNKVYTDRLNRISMVEKKTRFEFTDPIFQLGVDEKADVDGSDGFTNSPYGVSKLVCEKYTREYGKQYNIPYIINRMSCIYGLFQKGVEEQGWVDWFLRAKKYGLPLTIYGNGKQVRDLLFSQDVAELHIYEVEHMDALNGLTFNVGGGNHNGFNISIIEMIQTIDKLFPGKKLSHTYKPWRASDHRIFISNINKVISNTDWSPKTPIIDGLKMMWKILPKEKQTDSYSLL